MERKGSLNEDLTHEEITQNILNSEKLNTGECEKLGNGDPVLSRMR